MRSFFKLSLALACLFSACGVKKYPDIYYHHPMEYDGLSPRSAQPMVSPSPGAVSP